MSRDTHLAGSPTDLDRVATWLTDVVPPTSTFGDEVYGARSATGSAKLRPSASILMRE